MKFDGLICGDSDLLLKEMLDQNISVDLILTDPPYNLNKDFGNDSDKLSLDEFLLITKKRIDLCKNLLKDNGSIIWFGIHHYIGFIQSIMYEAGLNYRRMNIWYYENGFCRTQKAPLTQYEPFLWFSKSNKKWTYNVDDVRIPYKSTDRLKNPIYYKFDPNAAKNAKNGLDQNLIKDLKSTHYKLGYDDDIGTTTQKKDYIPYELNDNNLAKMLNGNNFNLGDGNKFDGISIYKSDYVEKEIPDNGNDCWC